LIDPFPHQDEGLEYLTERQGGYLFWKPRVGKTLPALMAILTSKTLPALIITKPSIMETFRKGLVYDLNIKPEKIGICRTGQAKEKREAIAANHKFVICNYQAAVPLRIMTAQRWRSIIFDESFALANIEARVTRYIERSIKKQHPEQVRIVLTGTPASESPRQYASQFFIVDGQYMGYTSIFDYMIEEWEQVAHNRSKLVVKRKEHLEEIKKYIHEHAFFLSLENIGKGSKILYNQRYVHLNDKQLKLLEWAKGKKEQLNKNHYIVGGSAGGIGDMVYAIYENMIASGIDPTTREIVNYAKINDVLDCYLDNREPILVVSFYVDLLPEAVRIFREAGVKCEYIDGTVIKTEAEEIRQRFQDGELDVVFGQSQVVAEGLDFSRANYTYTFNNSFSLNIREQVIMRTTNLNKTTPVEIIDICTEETFESKVVDKLNKKEKISNEFLQAHCRIK